MKKFTVEEEHFNCDGIREYKYHNFPFLWMAILKTNCLVKQYNKKWRNQDRIFIKRGDEWYNPNKKFSIWYGTAWNDVC